jgi:hypothetical protein
LLESVRDGGTFEGRYRAIEANAKAIMEAVDATDEDRQDASLALKLLALTRDAISRQDAASAAQWAAQLGELVERFDLAAEWQADALRGRAARDNGGMGGRPADVDRDIAMARAFQRGPTPGSRLSPTALKEEIGKAWGLKRSAAITAVDRGLKILSGKPANRTTG